MDPVGDRNDVKHVGALSSICVCPVLPSSLHPPPPIPPTGPHGGDSGPHGAAPRQAAPFSIAAAVVALTDAGPWYGREQFVEILFCCGQCGNQCCELKDLGEALFVCPCFYLYACRRSQKFAFHALVSNKSMTPWL